VLALRDLNFRTIRTHRDKLAQACHSDLLTHSFSSRERAEYRTKRQLSDFNLDQRSSINAKEAPVIESVNEIVPRASAN
jgi:hypothetical protein